MAATQTPTPWYGPPRSPARVLVALGWQAFVWASIFASFRAGPSFAVAVSLLFVFIGLYRPSDGPGFLTDVHAFSQGIPIRLRHVTLLLAIPALIAAFLLLVDFEWPAMGNVRGFHIRVFGLFVILGLFLLHSLRRALRAQGLRRSARSASQMERRRLERLLDARARGVIDMNEVERRWREGQDRPEDPA